LSNYSVSEVGGMKRHGWKSPLIWRCWRLTSLKTWVWSYKAVKISMRTLTSRYEVEMTKLEVHV